MNGIAKNFPPWLVQLLGALAVLVGYFSEPQELALLPHNVAHIVIAVGAALSFLGVQWSHATTNANVAALTRTVAGPNPAATAQQK